MPALEQNLTISSNSKEDQQCLLRYSDQRKQNQQLHKVNEKMNSSIKVIKRKQAEDSAASKPLDNESTVEQRKREMVSTVKSWIAEFQERKRAENHSILSLSLASAASRNS